MKKSANSIIRKILLGAAATLLHPVDSAANKALTPSIDSFDDPDNASIDILKRKTIKDVLRIKSNGEVMLIAGHSSHRSHSSHSSGSGGGGHYSHRSHVSSSTGSYGSGSSYSTYSTRTTQTTKKTYKLGDRQITKGTTGDDVKELTTLLVSKGYMRQSWISSKNGEYTYDDSVEAAIRHFQKDAYLTESGEADYSTIYRLKSWDISRTTYNELGLRDLYLTTPHMYGDDVKELLDLILVQEIDVFPHKSTLANKNGKPEFDEDFDKAVRFLQAYYSLPVDGKVNERMITVLRLYAK